MIKRLALAALTMSLAASARADSPQGGHILELGCLEALVAVDQARLAGVFAFIPEKDTLSAFADLLARDPAALKKYVAKVEADLKGAFGISQWDRDALVGVITLYGSPLADTFSKPAPKVVTRISELTQAPVLPLEQITARRKKA